MTLPQPLDLHCGATPTLPGQVRLLLEIRLADWGITGPRFTEVRSDLFLVAAELITNAVDTTPDQPIKVSCVLDVADRLVKFAVWDGSERMPVARMPELSLETLDLAPETYDDNGGWGLPLVQALAANCGLTPTRPGKWVWAHLKV
jgi:hypothetical protein